MRAAEWVAPSSDLRTVFPNWPKRCALWFVGAFSTVLIGAGLAGFFADGGKARTAALVVMLCGVGGVLLALAHRSRLLIDSTKRIVISGEGLWPLCEGSRRTISFRYPWHWILAVSMMMLSLGAFWRGHFAQPAEFVILNLVLLQQFFRPPKLPSTTIGRLEAPFNRSSAYFLVRKVGIGSYSIALVDDDRCSILARRASLDHFIELNDLSRWLGLRIEADANVMKEIDARR